MQKYYFSLVNNTKSIYKSHKLTFSSTTIPQICKMHTLHKSVHFIVSSTLFIITYYRLYMFSPFIRNDIFLIFHIEIRPNPIFFPFVLHHTIFIIYKNSDFTYYMNLLIWEIKKLISGNVSESQKRKKMVPLDLFCLS